MGKVLFFIFVFIWLRGTLPRLRYDQFMHFGWKRLIPVVAALDRCWSPRSAPSTTRGGFNRTWLIVAAVILAVAAGRDLLHPGEGRGDGPRQTTRPFDAFAGGYPVPPMPDGQSRCEAAAGKEY